MIERDFWGSKRFVASFLLVSLTLLVVSNSEAQVSLRQKIAQMVMVTFMGDSLEKSSPSLDTLKTDLAEGNIGGVVMFTWSNNLRRPTQITHLTQELQRRASTPLLLAIDEEGGQVARLSASNGFANTPSEFQLGSTNNESNTRAAAATMAGWFVQTGLNVNLAPVVDVNMNPNSPAIGALGRSFSADPNIVAANARWFIDEFHKKKIMTTLKHFPGHGSAIGDTHLGLVDVTNTWSDMELDPYRRLLSAGVVDLIMTAHVYNAKLDNLYPATLSRPVLTDLLRGSLGFGGVVISDDMNMKAIVDYYGFDDAIVRGVQAGLDVLLYTTNIDAAGASLARHVVSLIEQKVKDGIIDAARIDQSYNRIIALKQRYLTSVAENDASFLPDKFVLRNYPNPFNPSTTISVKLPEREHVTLKIFDMLGREIVTLLDDEIPAGTKLVRWNAGNCSSGIYVAQLQTSHAVQNLKMMLVK